MGTLILLVAGVLLVFNGARLLGKAVALGKFSTGGWALLCLMFGSAAAGAAVAVIIATSPV